MIDLTAWSRTPDVAPALHLDRARFGLDYDLLAFANLKIVGLSKAMNAKDREIARLKQELRERTQ